MFSVPYLVAQATTVEAEEAATTSDIKATSLILSKSFGLEAAVPFAIHHPSVIPTLLSNRKEHKEKRKAAILLSKLRNDFVKEVTEK